MFNSSHFVPVIVFVANYELTRSAKHLKISEPSGEMDSETGRDSDIFARNLRFRHFALPGFTLSRFRGKDQGIQATLPVDVSCNFFVSLVVIVYLPYWEILAQDMYSLHVIRSKVDVNLPQ